MADRACGVWVGFAVVSRIMSEGKTPTRWVAELRARGIQTSERSLRDRVHAIGAFKRLCRVIVLLPEHIDRIYGIKPVTELNAVAQRDVVRHALLSRLPGSLAGVAEHFSRSPDEVVYFLRSEGRIKIGYARDFYQRIPAIRTSSPFPIDVIAVIAGDRDLEALLHGHFDHFRRHGEWFEEDGDLRDLIAELERVPKI